MILAAHQPHFMPWLGYFDKIRTADMFVVVDHVQFERQNFQNRTLIMSRSGPYWLTVPLRQKSRGELIFEKEIANERQGRISWGGRLFETLRHAYAKAPYFDCYAPFIQGALTQPWTRLADLNDTLLRFFLEELEITTPIVKSSTLQGVEGARSEMIRTLCKVLGATTYLSGAGGSRAYLDVALLAREEIDVCWQEFKHPHYPQFSGAEFVQRLSVVDILFNCGPTSAAILRGERVPNSATASTFLRSAM